MKILFQVWSSPDIVQQYQDMLERTFLLPVDINRKQKWIVKDGIVCIK